QGSVLTNKYAEGYPGKRYYGGCEEVDEAELLAIERAKQLFGCEYANVQPHSGSQANQAVFMVTMTPGDTFMGMNLDHGGHLTHVIAAKAVAFGEALRPEFKTYAKAVIENARALADSLQSVGFKIVSNGTDSHLMLVDLTPKSVSGAQAEIALERAGITTNKNSIPGDPL